MPTLHEGMNYEHTEPIFSENLATLFHLRRRTFWLHLYLVNTHGVGNVLNRLFSQIIKTYVQFVFDMIVDSARYTDTPTFGNTLYTGCDIYHAFENL